MARIVNSKDLFQKSRLEYFAAFLEEIEELFRPLKTANSQFLSSFPLFSQIFNYNSSFTNKFCRNERFYCQKGSSSEMHNS